MPKRVTAAVTRPARTAVQGGAAYILVELVEAFGLYDFTGRQYAITLLALTTLLASVQAALENRLGVGLLRQVPPKTEPLVDDTGAIDAVTALVIVLLVLCILFVIGVLPVR